MSLSNPKRKIRVGIIFGGKSAEHEVSILSAKNVLQAINKEKYEPTLIAIDKSGGWHFDLSQEALLNGSISRQLSDSSSVPATSELEHLFSRDAKVASKANQPFDVIFPILHGPMGEDGVMQGLLEMANLPYVGPGVLGSAIGMDKDVMKRLLRDSGINVADFTVLKSADLNKKQVDEIVQKLGLPLFVKPANMGSSIGVSKVDIADKLVDAVQEALHFDSKVLVERTVVGDEIECAVLGNDYPKASVIGRIIPKNDFYSYQAKYIDEDGAALEIPAQLPSDVTEKARRVAIQAFTATGCEGLARVDMFARQDGTILVNEINTIPGFTKISMYPKLWEASGLTYAHLIDRLLELAIERYKRRQNLATNYDGHL